MVGRIPTTVVTGFLGAGKTTLIRHLLNHSMGKRVALIVNEFGDLGVDGSILEGCGITGCTDNGIVELSNGCICCAVAEEFTPAMLSLIDMPQPPDHIIIETSGLALPQPLIRAFNWPQLKTRVTVDGVVAVVDSHAVSVGTFAYDQSAVDQQRRSDENIDHETPLAELFDDQLVSADLVLLNKADLLSEEGICSVEASVLGRIRAGVPVVKMAKGVVSPEIVLGIAASVEDELNSRSEIHHAHSSAHETLGEDLPDHDHDEFESFVVELPAISKRETLTSCICDVTRQFKLLRIKGFAAVDGRPMRLVVQAVGPRVDSYFDRNLKASEHGRTRLVVIGMAGIEQQEIASTLAVATET